MALTTTPGAADADSYFTIGEADAYFDGRGISAWTGDDAVKEAAARRGTSYLDNQYRGMWVGIAAAQGQALAWPRVDGDRRCEADFTFPLSDENGFEVPDDVIPPQVKTAAMEAALLALTGVTLEPRLERGGRIKSQSKGVGPLSKSTTWEDGAPTVDRYTAIEGLLRGLVRGTPGATSGNIRLVRS